MQLHRPLLLIVSPIMLTATLGDDALLVMLHNCSSDDVAHLRGGPMVHGIDDGAQRMPLQLRPQDAVVQDVEQYLHEVHYMGDMPHYGSYRRIT